MQLRSGKSKDLIPWKGAERRDLGDRIYILAHEYERIDDAVKDLYKRKSEERLLFDVKDAVAWARRVNTSISKRCKDYLDV